MHFISIDKIFFSSYKKFKNEEQFEIRPVTVLVGKNSSGKSSICKLFPMLANSLTPYHNIAPLLFDNDGVCLGTSFSDISHNGDSVGLSFGVELENGLIIYVSLVSEDLNQNIMIEKYTVNYEGKEYILNYDKKGKSYSTNFQRETYKHYPFWGFYCEDLFNKLQIEEYAINVDYIGPFRIMPQRTYYSKGMNLERRIGFLGENAYDELVNSPVLAERVSEWYEKNFGCKLSVDWIEGVKGAFYVNLINTLSNNSTNIVDEGQGMSQVLPIVVRCNMAYEKSIVVIEQPELHLHPKAHASLGKLFATTSKMNGQKYIVETHSENLLLGIREAVVDSTIEFSPEDVIVYFVDEDEDGSAYLRKIEIDNDGMLSDWPTGVFNESYDLLSRIKAMASKKSR